MSLLSTMPESRVLLHGIAWETYGRLRKELDGPSVRLTYDRGDLEIMSPSHGHERWKKRVGRMIETMTLALRVPVVCGGSQTFQRSDLACGIEPDECYWIQSAAAVHDRDEIDLQVDPPPDLVVESEASRSLLDRLGILAALGVGEAWRYDGSCLTVLVREGDRYVVAPQSRCFPWLPLEPFAAQLQAARGVDDTTWLVGFERWVRSTLRVS